MRVVRDADDEGDDQRLLRAAHSQREVVAAHRVLAERVLADGTGRRVDERLG